MGINEISLAGKVAIVTGGGRGIGKSITKHFVAAGANVVIASRKPDVLKATAAELADAPGRIHCVACNVGRKEDIENLVAETESAFGPADILVNNSVTNIGQGPSLDVTDEMLDKMVDVNVKSALRLIRLTVPRMIERGTGGSIINVVSISGMQPQFQGLLYSFTKAGLIMMTRNWAQELSPQGVRVNALAPGLIRTDFSEFFWKNESLMRRLEAVQPVPRIGEPDDIGFAALFLASDKAAYMTGQVVTIDGGALIQRVL